MIKRKIHLRDGLWVIFESDEDTKSIKDKMEENEFIVIGNTIINTKDIQLIEEIKQ